MKKRLSFLILWCCMLPACAALQLPTLPTAGPVQVGTIGDKGGYIVRGAVANPAARPCSTQAYTLGFKKGYAKKWNELLFFRNSLDFKKYSIRTDSLPSSSRYNDYKNDECGYHSYRAGEGDAWDTAERDFDKTIRR